MLAFALALSLAAPQHLIVDGVDRTYRVYRPASLSRERAAPLVVVLHGGFGSGAQAERAYGWDREADAHAFVVVYPDGVNRAWNAGTCCGRPQRDAVNDVRFLTDVIQTIEREERIDPHAIGSVAGTMLVPCASARATSVIDVHGRADHLVPYAGGRGEGFAHVSGPSLPSVYARWLQIDRCDVSTSERHGSVTTEHADCPATGSAVSFVSIDDAGHAWPQGTTDELYRFFFEGYKASSSLTSASHSESAAAERSSSVARSASSVLTRARSS